MTTDHEKHQSDNKKYNERCITEEKKGNHKCELRVEQTGEKYHMNLCQKLHNQTNLSQTNKICE